MSCEDVQRRLEEALLARVAAEQADRAHAEQCAACAEHARFLRELAADLDRVAAPALRPAALAASRERAVRALRVHRIPRGFAFDLVRALALALIALPVALGHGYLVVRGAQALLGGFVPEPLLLWLGLVYFGSLALAMGVLYGSIPLAVAAARRSRMEFA